MLLLAADHNFNNDILEGLRQRSPDVNVVRVQDVSLATADDRTILAWAASEGRVLLTHDIRTFPGFAYERVATGLPMPGVFAVSQRMSIGQAIDEILVIVECSVEGEWEGQVRHLPL